VRKPRGQSHTFWNAGDEPLRFLEIISPRALAGYFRELEIDFSTIPALAERHGLRVEVLA